MVASNGNESPLPRHGEFMSQTDMATDFDSQPQPLPLEPMLPLSQVNQAPQQQPDPNTFNIQQYLQAYQQTLDSQPQQQPTSDLVSTALAAQKKSDPVVIGVDAPEVSTVAPAATTIQPVIGGSANSLLTQLNNSAADEADNVEAMRALVSLINSYIPGGPPTSEDQVFLM